ncbi:MAG TPA: universal stress protein [Chitinophagaceae bacterium]|nr:universal stress protein [Chitinophagaceae bacterium]MCB9055098.1 universal stress protein [Chitinophagales bacterium]HPG10931.1 universal stress protein [Chitinophagaceae bacterium]HRX93822.1 universal stress protein [Chitinophagaceae bacterium]
MKTIIVPTDFSPVATNALHYAIDMAKSIKASLMLLHVYNIPVSYTDVPVVLVSVEEMKKTADEKINELKKEVEHIVSGEVKVYAETRLGNVADELENLCNSINPFAVVMGSKGASGIERMIFGSNTLTAIRHLTWPVICVPPGKTFGSGIKKVGFACDFKNVVESTPVHFIRDLVNEWGAELLVLNVDHKEKHFTPDTPEQSALLHTMLEGARPQYHFIDNEDIEDGINEFAEKNNLDMIITIPKKHKLLEGIFKPSSTKQLVYQSHVPVMCIHE